MINAFLCYYVSNCLKWQNISNTIYTYVLINVSQKIDKAYRFIICYRPMATFWAPKIQAKTKIWFLVTCFNCQSNTLLIMAICLPSLPGSRPCGRLEMIRFLLAPTSACRSSSSSKPRVPSRWPWTNLKNNNLCLLTLLSKKTKLYSDCFYYE